MNFMYGGDNTRHYHMIKKELSLLDGQTDPDIFENILLKIKKSGNLDTSNIYYPSI